MDRIRRGEEVFWLNGRYRAGQNPAETMETSAEEIDEAAARLERFAPVIRPLYARALSCEESLLRAVQSDPFDNIVFQYQGYQERFLSFSPEVDGHLFFIQPDDPPGAETFMT